MMIEKRSLSAAAGFTLVELLVVISIIAILAGLSMTGVMMGRQSGEEGAVKSNITGLVTLLEQYAVETGGYPPSSLSFFRIPSNGINEGIESVLACLETRKYNGPFIGDLDEKQRGNVDADTISKLQADHLRKRLDWKRTDNQLWEYCDLWGNPLIYIHSRDYSEPVSIQTIDGETITVSAKRDPETGGFYRPTEFQLWSLGVDGENGEYDEGDDICHWK